MPIVLSLNGLLVKESIIVKEYGMDYLVKLKDKLTIVSRVEKVEKVLKMYKMISDKILLLPRMLVKNIVNMFPDERFINNIPVCEDMDIVAKVTFKLFNNQRIFVDKLMEDVFTEENSKNGMSSCIAKMGTGEGKSYLAAAVIARLRKKTLIVVHDKGMQNNEFSSVLLNTLDGLNLCVKNDDTLIEKANVVILVINTVMKKSVDFFKQFGLIIMDEIHMYCTEKRAEIFWNANVQYVLGLSATPDEKRDLFHKIAICSVGKIIDVETLEGYESASKFKAEVRAIKYYAPAEYILHESNKTSGMLMTHKTVMKMLEDPYRDRLVISLLNELLAEKHSIYIFCQYRESVMHYYRLIKSVNGNNVQNDHINNKLIYAPEAYPMMGGITNDAYENARMKGNIIIITYSYGGTGKSIPKMTAAIFASPMRSNWTQISGRILRLGSDASIVRKYIDIIDGSTILKYQFYGTKKDQLTDKTDKTRRKTRKEVYDERGFPITYESVHYTNLYTDEERKLNNINDNNDNNDINEQYDD